MTPISQRDPLAILLDKIIEEPDRDDLRLQYASYCERTDWEDSSRGWLIRLQVKLASIPGGMDHSEWLRFSLETRELLREKAEFWTPRWYSESGIRDPEFHRGFVECVTATAVALLQRPIRAQLFRSGPISHLNLVEVGGDTDFSSILQGLSTDGFTSRLLSLRLDGQSLTDESLLALINARLPRLRWLSLVYNKFEERGVGALAEASVSGGLRQLAYVRLEGNPFNPVEQIHEDQGFVISRQMPDIALRMPPAQWLRRRVAGNRAVYPSRFETSPRTVAANHASSAGD